MAIKVVASINSMAASYVSGHTYLGVAAADPGTTATPASEASGGTPAYARKATTWSAGTTGVQNGTQQSIDLAAGAYAWMLLCGSATGNNMWDNCSFASQTLAADGPLLLTPTYTQV